MTIVRLFAFKYKHTYVRARSALIISSPSISFALLIHRSIHFLLVRLQSAFFVCAWCFFSSSSSFVFNRIFIINGKYNFVFSLFKKSRARNKNKRQHVIQKIIHGYTHSVNEIKETGIRL